MRFFVHRRQVLTTYNGLEVLWVYGLQRHRWRHAVRCSPQHRPTTSNWFYIDIASRNSVCRQSTRCQRVSICQSTACHHRASSKTASLLRSIPVEGSCRLRWHTGVVSSVSSWRHCKTKHSTAHTTPTDLKTEQTLSSQMLIQQQQHRPSNKQPPLWQFQK